MKIRDGFVSNSSSASFVLGKNFLSKKQIEKFSEWLGNDFNSDNYESFIHETPNYFHGRISIHEEERIIKFLKEIKVNKKYVEISS